jgi:hypothetical protein
MRFMVMVKATQASESGELPTTDGLARMGAFNEELARSGAMLAGEGLLPSSKGARIRYSDGTPTIAHGPFASVRELMAGFWIVRADSLDEAISLIKKAPLQPGAEVEIRQIAEAADFGQAMTPEVREVEERLGTQMAMNAR